jgi:hypothetical protein
MSASPEKIRMIAGDQVEMRPDRSGAPTRLYGWTIARAIIVTVLCNACARAFMSEARGQCRAQDVLQNRLTHKEACAGAYQCCFPAKPFSRRAPCTWESRS